MNWSIIFTIAIFAILLRVFWLRVKANAANTESFKRLPPKDKLAVLKECMLNNPSEGSLANLKEFCESENLNFDANGYRPFIKRQLELADRNANYVECDALYIEECEFLDRTKPIEFAEAQKSRQEGNEQEALVRTLEGISRLYSDLAIKTELQKLEPTYPKAIELLAGYEQLIENCKSSSAEPNALEVLRKQREAWIESLLTIER